MAAMPPTEMALEWPTEVVQDAPQAWSVEEEPTWRYKPRRDWGRTLRQVATFAVPTLGFLIVAAFILGGHPRQENPVPAPPTAVVPSTVNPAPDPSAQDDQFLRLVNNAGLMVTNRTDALAGGHWVCTYLGLGHTQREVLEIWDGQRIPDQTPEEEHRYNLAEMDAAIQAFCPQYR